uniref:Peptidase A1 domain-containing protein n=1 Tax=Araucaria cunninghamii TaxID=56994 RepID=A0A0D6R4R2_ARACU
MCLRCIPSMEKKARSTWTGPVSSQSSLVERDTQRTGRRLQALSKATHFTMQGAVYPDGIYYITLYIGIPPQPYFMDVDTGSDLTWLQCNAPCRKCAQGPHQLYKPRQYVSCKEPLCQPMQASSHQRYDCKSPRQQCDYDIKYADRGSSMGVLVKDIALFYLANRTVARASSVFGCGYDQDGSLGVSPAHTDGVLGLGAGMVSLPSQWSKEGLIKNVIGLCVAGGGKRGGYMFFGDEYVPNSGMTWVPMLGKPAMKHYYVGAAQMIFGKKLLVKDGDEKRLGGIIFDSGSSYTYFINQSYALVLSAVHESIGKYLVKDSTDKTLPICWKGKKKFSSVADVKSYFKPLLLNFRTSSYSRSAKLEIPPEGYLIISRNGNVCLGILNGTGVANHNILGDISLQGYLLVLDNGNNRVGWVRADCTKVSKPVIRRQALEDPSQSHEDETIPCSQDLEQAVCPSSSCFVPEYGVSLQSSQ